VEGPPASKPCYTDEMTAILHRAYPHGVPGRNLPAPYKVEQVGADITYYIPVVVHVLHAYGAEQNITEAQILSQIRVMNECFGRRGVGFNTNPLSVKCNVQFCLAQIDPDGNPTTGYEYIESQYATELDPVTEDTLMKRLSTWNPDAYLNVWTVRRIKGGLEGYTYLPHEVAGTVWDGVIMDYESFGAFPNGTAKTLGYTLAHEAGHYLGLYHPWGIFEDSCGVNTDYCDDTPPVPRIFFSSAPNCLAPLACDGTRRQIANYMDYSDDACQNMFTQCQVARMLNNLITYRGQMVSGANLLLTGCATVADTLPALDSIFVYPSPAASTLFVTIDIADVGPARLEITDMTGRVVYKVVQGSYGRGTIAIDVREFSKGTYVLHVSTDKAQLRRRITIGY
jgi:hypothetical protein